MHINELSRLSGINKETIRSYREKGFLHPHQDTNGYYNYTSADFASLMYLVKMRTYQISLDDISRFYHPADINELDEVFDKEEAKVRARIHELESSLRFLEFERRHVHESFETDDQEVLEQQSIDEKIDFYDFYEEGRKKPARFTDILQTTTPTLFISKDILNGPVEDRAVPMKAGLGTYRYLIEEKNLKVPEGGIIVPNGICLSQMLVVSSLDEVNIMQLAPMMNYAKEHGRTFLSDTTGYLMRVETGKKDPVFYFRIRACVEENSIKDQGIH